MVCFHNHCSGDPAPSHEDITLTKRLTEAGTLLGVELAGSSPPAADIDRSAALLQHKRMTARIS
ncbi:hypothetical protein ET464_12885 [Paenibacillus protaetiae]|uniref:RadC-like JAB domain-containing protein n=1 Tax=Paenibacillus protaetiae TaxID=2509456 RepID=A0A4P6FD63_9BACL|nr:hypothetical protein ET464_12885 [Paenibacillus protaetiae]